MSAEMIGKIRCFVLDMDGTVYLGSRLLPEALEFIEYLRRTQRDFLFVTNNSSRHAEYYASKLTKLGIDCDAANILTSGEATAFYINTLKKGARIFLLGTPELEEEFQRQGFTLTSDAPDFVVLGFDKTLTYAKLVNACDWILAGHPVHRYSSGFKLPDRVWVHSGLRCDGSFDFGLDGRTAQSDRQATS